jgi:hypothetical protein
MKNAVFWNVTLRGSEEPSASIIRVTRIDELGTKLAVTSNTHAAKKYKVYANYTNTK